MATPTVQRSVAQRVADLLAAKRRIKIEIRRKKEELHAVSTELAALERECDGHGISLVIVQRHQA